MYFSKKNKNYMYQTLSNVIYDETGIQITESKKYIELYRLHYPSIFENVDTDELSSLNKEIINKIGSLILKEMSFTDSLKPNIDQSNQSNQSDQSDQSDQSRKSISIYSSQRLKESVGLYNFTVPVTFSEIQPLTITLLKEQNSLFGNLNINILFNDTDNLLFKLKDTFKLGNLEYYTYECLTDDIISSLNHSLKIQIRNYLMNDVLPGNDLHSIKKSKIIKYLGKDHLCLEIEDHDIKVGEELGLLRDSNVGDSIFVKYLVDDYVLTDKSKIDLSTIEECLQMNKNITLTGLIKSD
tara:strand:+ start:2901 stop:3791 length:891 start_codon:yes stop_codon:yes gene_type:complete